MPPLRRGLAALAPTLLILILAGCRLSGAAVLEVTPDGLLLDSDSRPQYLLISNEGDPGSLLGWEIISADAPVLFTPTRGTVRAGSPAQQVTINADFSGLKAGTLTEAAIEIRSNGGNVQVPLRLLAGSRTCGAAPIRVEPHGTAPDGPEFVPGELLVGLASLAGNGWGSKHGITTLHGLTADYGFIAPSLEGQRLSDHDPVLRLEVDDPVRAAARLEGDRRVAFAHPNYYLTALSVPNDPCYPDQWSLSSFGVDRAWESAGHGSVVVAVIDTGVDVDHEDLRDKVLPGWDFFDSDRDVRPGTGLSGSAHGTHVAGIALATGDNGVGVAGVAYRPETRLLPIKLFSDSGSAGTVADLADAIRWAAGLRVEDAPRNWNPARLINISLGAGPRRIGIVDWAADKARDHGSLVIAAAGNDTSTDGKLGVQSPANAPGVLAIGSVDQDMARSSFSDWGRRGSSVDLMAPGGYGASSCGRIRSTLPLGGYGCMAGTSMAAPFVSGVAALVLAGEPDLSVDELEERLLEATYFDGSTMNRDEYGAGVLCANRAVAGVSARNTPCTE